MVVPFLTLYLTQSMHFSIAKASLVMAIFGAGAICGGVIGGKLTDKLGFYNIQLFALVAGGVLFIVLGQMRDFGSICGLTFFLALANESFRPANSSAIAHYSSSQNLTRGYSLNRLAINLGWATGGALGGFIASKNYELLFWIDGLTNIIAAMLLRMVLAPTGSRRAHSAAATATKEEPIAEKGRPAYKDKPFMVFSVLTVLFGLCFFQLFATLPVYFKEHLRLTAEQIGYVMALNGIMISLVEMPLVFSLEQRGNYMNHIVVGNLLCGLSFAVFNIFPGAFWLAIVSTVIVTVGEMMSMPFMNTFWTSRTTARNRGQYAGWYTVSWSVAQVIGPYSGGLIAQNFGFGALWWATGAVGVVCAAGFGWLKRRISVA